MRGGASLLQVLSGWVQIDNGLDEMLVPVGARAAAAAAEERVVEELA